MVLREGMVKRPRPVARAGWRNARSRKNLAPFIAVIVLIGLIGGGCLLWVRAGDDGPPSRIIAMSMAPTSVIVDSRSGRALVGDGSPTVVVLDTRDGRASRTVTLPGSVPVDDGMAVASSAGKFFVLSQIVPPVQGRGAAVSMIDGHTGAVVRTVAVAPLPVAIAIDTRTAHVFVIAVKTTKAGAPLSILDARNGMLLRTVYIPMGSIGEQIAVDSLARRVFVVDYQRGVVQMLDSQTGRLLHTTSVGRRPSGLAIDERLGHVFVINNGSGTVSMLDARTGRVLSTTTLPLSTPQVVAVDSRAGRALVGVGGNTGQVSILDARDGTVITTVNVGGFPSAIAVDEQRGRAVVTNTGSARSVLLHQWGHGRLAQLGEWQDDEAAVVDTRTGQILRRVHVAPTDSSGAAVDEADGSVFVVNQAGRSLSVLDR